jgi:hypothetical protein
MGGCLFGLAVICFVIGFIKMMTPDKGTQVSQPRPAFNPMAQNPTGSRRTYTPEAAGSMGVQGGETMVGKLQKLDWVQVGQRIRVQHPVRGEMMVHVVGRILYAELWQQSRGAQAPWVPTGNSFAGFWLEGSLFLLNWQSRLYLLDESTQLSDAEIQRDFLPHARRFAQSDQTAEVIFEYPPASWKIDDIGKFRVEQVDGEGLVFRQGAIGRFIHASGADRRSLVLEDYEGGGGGQDTVWIGYQIDESGIKPE